MRPRILLLLLISGLLSGCTATAPRARPERLAKTALESGAAQGVKACPSKKDPRVKFQSTSSRECRTAVLHCQKGYGFRIPKCGCGCVTEASLPTGHVPTVCRSDGDCVLSCRRIDRCCGELCACSIPYNKRTVALLERWHARRCKQTSCRVASCMPDRTTRKAVCKANRCALVEKKGVRG